MQKTAQKRGLLNKLREMTNVSGIAAEKLFNPELKKVLVRLRSADNHIRAIASGEAIKAGSDDFVDDTDEKGNIITLQEEDGDPGSSTTPLKKLLKSAKSNLNRREYMTAVGELSVFHEKIEQITKIIEKLNLNVDKVHHDFLFKDLPTEQRERLLGLNKRFSKSSQEKYEDLVKKAGIIDFLHNITSNRGKALAAWEKRYPRQIGKLKKDTESLMDKSQKTLDYLLDSLKSMATARATRKPDDYMQSANKVVSHFKIYDSMFSQYYNENVKGFLEKAGLLNNNMSEVPAVKIENSKDLGKQEVVVDRPAGWHPAHITPSSPTPELVPGVQAPLPPPSVVIPEEKAPDTVPNPPVAQDLVEPMVKTVPTASPAAVVAPAVVLKKKPMMANPTIDPNASQTKADNRPAEPLAKKTHSKFMESLQSLSEESPILIASYISKYAKSIQETDPKTAIQLFNIAQSIKG